MKRKEKKKRGGLKYNRIDERNDGGRKGRKEREKKKWMKRGRKEAKAEERRTEGLIVIIYLPTEVCL